MDLEMEEVKVISCCTDQKIETLSDESATDRLECVTVEVMALESMTRQAEDCEKECEVSHYREECDEVICDNEKMSNNGCLKPTLHCKCKPQKQTTLSPLAWDAFDQLFKLRMKFLTGLVIYFVLWLIVHFLFIIS
ncbi:uncharacterized protein LOC106667153 [Cimex lectularius]|uniref:Uncharacterized protein n=1 Tax=Cimex lectularius TaxID=79782 RepID=A0A8I6RYQ7_CIMLE|nr:uncharacterized protein LOC106667153 [Cimex lectularius]